MIYDSRFTIGSAARAQRNRPIGGRRSAISGSAGFTMIEVAICLAIIGIALVAIIGVLPYGMRAQRDNREQTIVNQDATVFIEAIRGGARGLDDLTNYVLLITNVQTRYIGTNAQLPSISVGYNNPYISGYNDSNSKLTNGNYIIGLLGTPEFTDRTSGLPATNIFIQDYYSNHVVAYVRSLSGPAMEKPPQQNDILRENSFSYRLFCVNAPMPVDISSFSLPFDQQVNLKQTAANLHDLRLTFLFPLRQNGSVGPGRITLRTLVAGQVVPDPIIPSLYFYQSQSFTNAL